MTLSALFGPWLREVERPVESRVAAADDDEVLAGEISRVLHPVLQLRAIELVQAIDLERAGLECAHAGSDEDGLGEEPRALGGFDEEAAIVPLFNRLDFLPEVEGGAERLDLLEQVVRQFLARAHRNGRDVVDRLVGVQLDALAARVGQRIDHMGLDLQQAEFEHLEQARRGRRRR